MTLNYLYSAETSRNTQRFHCLADGERADGGCEDNWRADGGRAEGGRAYALVCAMLIGTSSAVAIGACVCNA